MDLPHSLQESPHVSFAALNSDLAFFFFFYALRALQTEISNTPPDLQLNTLSLPHRKSDYFLKYYYKNRFLECTESVHIGTASPERNAVCSASSRAALQRMGSWEGFSLPVLFCAFQGCPYSACPIIQTFQIVALVFQSLSVPSTEKDHVYPALALLFCKFSSFSLITQLK